MVNINDFGICNFRLVRKVMGSGKCQCKPDSMCPCSVWIMEGICDCGIFWTDKKELTKSEIKICEAIRDRLDEMIEKALEKKK